MKFSREWLIGFNKERLEEILTKYTTGAITNDRDERSLRNLSVMHGEDVCHTGMTQENGKFVGTAKLYPNGIRFIKYNLYQIRVENSKLLQFWEGFKAFIGPPYKLA